MSLSSQTETDVILFDLPWSFGHPTGPDRSQGSGGKPPQKFKVLWQQPILHHGCLHFPWSFSRFQRAPVGNLPIAQGIKPLHTMD